MEATKMQWVKHGVGWFIAPIVGSLARTSLEIRAWKLSP